jgi:hypothetical protein
MDWRKIMSEAGIPDSPGRDEVIKKMKEPKPYRATFRDKRSGMVRTERIMALNFKDALHQVRGQASSVLTVVEDW